MEGACSYYIAGDYEKSIEYGEQALTAAKESGNKEGEEEACRVLARSYYWAGDYEKSIEQGKQALRAAKEIGSKERETKAYIALAWSYNKAGDYEKSIEQGQQALSADKEIENEETKAAAFSVLDSSYYEAGDYEKSIEYGKQALSGAKKIGRKEMEADAYTSLAWSYYWARDYENSIEQGKHALSAAKEIGSKEKKADAYDVLAWSYYRAGDYEKSIEKGKQLLTAAKEIENKEKEAAAYNVLDWSYYMDGDYKKSIEQGIKALSAAKELGNKEEEAEAYTSLARSYYWVGDYKNSIEQGKQALRAAKEIGSKERKADAYDALAWSYYKTGDYEKSIEQGKKALSAAKKIGNKEMEADAYHVLTKSYHGLGDHSQARFHDDRRKKIQAEIGLQRSSSACFHDDSREKIQAEIGLPSGSSARFHDDRREKIQAEIGLQRSSSEKLYMPEELGEDAIEKDLSKTKIHEETVTSEGAHWDLKVGDVHLTFPPNAVCEPTPIVVHKWNCSACSPPLEEHEAIVSNVIEISTICGQALQFNSDLKLFLSHNATDLQGYELVIKKQIDKKSNIWKDVDGTKDLRHASDIEDDYPSPKDIPDFFFPIAQVDITECSTYAVVCRLKSSPSYTITSNGGTFNHPDYLGVTVTIPKEGVERKAKFSLQLKVQEIPSGKFEAQDVFIGPILRIICSQAVHFLKPVTIRLPVSLRDGRKGIPTPSTGRVRVLFLESDSELKEWNEISGDLKHADFDGKFVWFRVTHFSAFLPVLDWGVKFEPSRWKRYFSSIFWNQPRQADFVASFGPSDHSPTKGTLYLICCPYELRSEAMEEQRRNNRIPSVVTSKEYLVPGYDRVFVFLSGGISSDMDVDCQLRFESKSLHNTELKVNLTNDEDMTPNVEFRSTQESAGENLLATIVSIPFKKETRAIQEETCGPKTVNVDAEVKGKIKTSQGKKELKVKDGMPSNDDLEWISKKIPTWKPLGRRLQFDDAALTGFEKGNDELCEKAYAMLMAWKAREGSDATYKVLYNALRHELVGRLDLAEEFCCH